MPIVTVTVDQLDHTASLGTSRNHTLVMDRPVAKGGQNKGPMGGETLLMGLGGCFLSNLFAAANGRDIRISNVRVEITAEYDETKPVYTDIHMKVTADSAFTKQFRNLVLIAEKDCISANTLSKAVSLRIDCY